MISITQISNVAGFEAAILGMRLAKESFDKSDSVFYDAWLAEAHDICGNVWHYDADHIWVNKELGKADLELMNRLAKAGSEHAKYRRAIIVHAKVTAPIYWWKEMDTYKVGVTRLSDSTMHNIHKHEFTPDDFSNEHLLGYFDVEEKYEESDLPELEIVRAEAGIYPFHVEDDCMPAYSKDWLKETCKILNAARKRYLETKDKKYWWQMIQLLPSTYNQTSVLCMNYEVLSNIYRQRKNHKLDEWLVFCDWIERLPYAKEVITGD